MCQMLGEALQHSHQQATSPPSGRLGSNNSTAVLQGIGYERCRVRGGFLEGQHLG